MAGNGRACPSSAKPCFSSIARHELLLPLPAVGLYKPMRYLGHGGLKWGSRPETGGESVESTIAEPTRKGPPFPRREFLVGGNSLRSSRWLSLLALAVCWFQSGCHWQSKGINTSGVQLYQQGRYAEALQQFETARQTNPTDPDALYNLASTYHQMGIANKDSKLLEQAESTYNQCLDVSPNHIECHRGLAVLLVQTNRSDRAFDFLKRWNAQAPGLADARLELSRLHYEFGQTKLAEQYIDEALAMNPVNYKAWTAKGRMRESANDYAQAMKNYQQSLAINQAQPDVVQRMGALQVKMASAAAPGSPYAGAPGTITTQAPTGQTRY